MKTNMIYKLDQDLVRLEIPFLHKNFFKIIYQTKAEFKIYISLQISTGGSGFHESSSRVSYSTHHVATPIHQSYSSSTSSYNIRYVT